MSLQGEEKGGGGYEFMGMKDGLSQVMLGKMMLALDQASLSAETEQM